MVQRLNAAAVQAIRSDDMRGRLLADGMFAAGSTADEFAAFLQREGDRWAPLLRRLDLSG